MTDKQPELIPTPREEKVLAALRAFRKEVADERTKAYDTITKKKEEIELLDKEIDQADQAIRIVKEDLMTPAAPVEKPLATKADAEKLAREASGLGPKKKG